MIFLFRSSPRLKRFSRFAGSQARQSIIRGLSVTDNFIPVLCRAL
jgi:hypothetical protein